MEAFNFYQLVGVLAPGSILLISVVWLYDVSSVRSVLTPDNFGGLGVHLILAYVIGQFLQVIGNVIEKIYWIFWGGMPSDWPITRPSRQDFPKAMQAVYRAVGEPLFKGSEAEKLADWHRVVSQVRSTIYTTERAKRLDTFSSNYGLLRGVLANLLILAFLMIGKSDWYWVAYPTLAILALLAFVRMHRFGAYYARELFASAAEIARLKDSEAKAD